MRLTSRLCFSLIGSVAAVSLVIAYFQTRADTRGLHRELERHALVLADTLAKSAEPLLANGSRRELQRLVDRFKNREQTAGIAVYDLNGEPAAVSSGLAPRLDGIPQPILQSIRDGATHADFIRMRGDPMHVVALPLRQDPAPIGVLAIFHDTAYIEAQTASLWRRALIGVGIQTLLIASITLLTIRWGFGRPLIRMTRWLRDLRAGQTTEALQVPARGEFEPLTQEVTRLASSLVAARAAAEEEARLRESAESNWTAERLRVFVQSRLGGDRLFAVSNREPYEHVRGATEIECRVPASGLVTALEPVLRACDGTWIAQATGDADSETADEDGRVRVPPDQPKYTLRRVWLTPEQQQGFYFGFANEGLWPLCHIAHTRPTFRIEDWEAYRDVNEKFAGAVLEEIRNEETPVVLVQDYHFALLPRMIKQRRPDARVAIFWHIPWPNSEAFAICPWQRELLDGLLGADLIGFHIQAHCNNFLETVDRTLESRVDRERFSVTRNAHHTLVRPFPISVAFPTASADQAEKSANPAELPHLERAELLGKLGVRASFMGVGVDRIDYTKGIPERFRGIERFLERCPAYKNEFTFVQIGAPSRTHIPRYDTLMQEVIAEAERVNRRFQTGNWKPIVLLARQHSHAEILPYYRTADVCLVTSLHDGMNLVAKEFVASRNDDQGVLILSRFAGASHELADALVVNPYDAEEVAHAIHRALEMSPEERRIRMQRMRTTVRERNIYRWAGSLIEELCAIRTGSSARRLALVRSAANYP
ncbi:MAG TPA: trehalose-6-phosphate synthase [Bryobacteraceae bacterium]|nr:trehalose-6-phosphate synthase [Bryobacteraceae bacterium]